MMTEDIGIPSAIESNAMLGSLTQTRLQASASSMFVNRSLARIFAESK